MILAAAIAAAPGARAHAPGNAPTPQALQVMLCTAYRNAEKQGNTAAMATYLKTYLKVTEDLKKLGKPSACTIP